MTAAELDRLKLEVAAEVVRALKDEGLVRAEDPLRSVPEMARQLGIRERLARSLIYDGEPPKIASLKINGARRVEQSEIDRYLAERRVAGQGGAGEDQGS